MSLPNLGRVSSASSVDRVVRWCSAGAGQLAIGAVPLWISIQMVSSNAADLAKEKGVTAINRNPLISLVGAIGFEPTTL